MSRLLATFTLPHKGKKKTIPYATAKHSVTCSFCGNTEDTCMHIVLGQGIAIPAEITINTGDKKTGCVLTEGTFTIEPAICDECVALCQSIIATNKKSGPAVTEPPLPTGETHE